MLYTIYSPANYPLHYVTLLTILDRYNPSSLKIKVGPKSKYLMQTPYTNTRTEVMYDYTQPITKYKLKPSGVCTFPMFVHARHHSNYCTAIYACQFMNKMTLNNLH